MTDNVIVEKLKRREEDGFSLLLDRYSSYVSAIITSIANGAFPREDIEELAADVFVAVWNSAEKLLPGRPLKPYLAKIARNAAISKLRQGSRDCIPFDDDILVVSRDAEPDELAFQREQTELINEAVGSFGEPDREVFLRFYFYGERVRDIGERLHLNAATVKTKLRRCRKKLAALLTERGYRYEDEAQRQQDVRPS